MRYRKKAYVQDHNERRKGIRLPSIPRWLGGYGRNHHYYCLICVGWLIFLGLLTSCSPWGVSTRPTATIPMPPSITPRLTYPAPPASATPVVDSATSPVINPTSTSPHSTSIPVNPTSDAQWLAGLPGRILFLRESIPYESDQVYQFSQGQIDPLTFVGSYITASPDGHFLVAAEYNKRELSYKYIMLDTNTNTITDLSIRVNSLATPLVVASDGLHMALNYRCDLTDVRVITGWIADIAAQWPAIAARVCENESSYEEAHTWHPDNEHLILTSQEPDNTSTQASAGDNEGARLIERNLSGQERVLSEAYWMDVRVSAEGRFIIGMQYANGSKTLWLIDRTTNTEIPIQIPGMTPSQAILSPDGRYIIFSENSSFEEPDQCLYLYDLLRQEDSPVCLVQGYKALAWLLE